MWEVSEDAPGVWMAYSGDGTQSRGPYRTEAEAARKAEQENWNIGAHAINGQTGSHYDLAAWVEGKGFQVEADHENNERSIIARPGSEDFGEREIGEILGDAEAVVRINVLD